MNFNFIKNQKIIFNLVLSFILTFCFVFYNFYFVFATPPNGDTDLNFSSAINGGLNGEVKAIAVQSNGDIIVGGAFSGFSGGGSYSPNKLVRFNSSGNIDTNFYSNIGPTAFNGNVNAIAVQTDGKILVGGDFTTVNGSSYNRLVRLNSSGSIDTTFVVGTGFDNSVNAIAIQSDGKILVGGNFTTFKGLSQNKIARLSDANGSLDTTLAIGAGFNPGGTVGIRSLVIQPDGKILAGGDFTNYNGTTSINKLVRLTSTGAIDTTLAIGTGFNNANGVYAIALEPSGNIIVGGAFTTLNGPSNSRIRLVRLSSLGAVDTAFYNNYINTNSTGLNERVKSLAIQSDGKILVGGLFTYLNDINNTANVRNRLIRLNSNGTEDTTFYSNISPAADGVSDSINVLKIQPSDEKILVGGLFANFDGASRNNIVRLGSTPSSVIITPITDVAVTEGNVNNSAYSVVLGAAPTANVTVNITESSNAIAINPPTQTLTFTTSNWNTPQFVSILGSEDSNTINEVDQLLTFDPSSADTSYNALPNQTRNIDVTDNDTPSFNISPVADITIIEGSTNSTAFQVVLGTEPTSNVVIDITESSPQITLNTTSLTFTTSNWNVPQNVSITGTEDNSNSVNEVDQVVTFAINDASSDNLFDPLPNQTRQIDFTDNDIPSFIITQTGGNTSVIEQGATDSFSIVLGAQPTGNVVFNLTSSDTTALTVSPSLTYFNIATWNTPIPFTVTAPDDPDTVSEEVTITVSIDQALTADTNYDILPSQNFIANVTDNDITEIITYQNKFPPINASTVTQRKSGSLKVGGINSTAYARFDGLLKIPTGAGAGLVLTSNASGDATWSNPSSSGNGGGWTLSGNNVSLTTLTDGISLGNNSVIYKQGSRFIHSNGTGNFFAGINSGSLNPSGTSNTGVGKDALLGLVGTPNGEYNTAIGYQALSKGDGWLSGNTAVGSKALGGGTTYGGGLYNTAVGYEALLNTYTTAGTGIGTVNTGVGYQALKNNTTGSYNVAVGSGTLINNTTGSYNIAIGFGAGPTTSNLYNTVAIGYGTTVAQSNKVRLGNTSIQYVFFPANPTVISDLRLKENINDSDLGLDFINRLRPVSYKLKGGNGIDYGFIAQEVETAIGKPTNIVLTENTEFGMKTLRYEDLISPLIKATQEQFVELNNDKKELEDFEERLIKLENRLR